MKTLAVVIILAGCGVKGPCYIGNPSDGDYFATDCSIYCTKPTDPEKLS